MPELLALTMTRVLHLDSHFPRISRMNELREVQRDGDILKVGPASPWTDTGLFLDLASAPAATGVIFQQWHSFLLIQMSVFLYNCTLLGSPCPPNVTYLRCLTMIKDPLDFKEI